MLLHLLKRVSVVSATDTPVVLQNVLCEAGSTQFNIANDGESRQLVCYCIDLPALVGVREVGVAIILLTHNVP